MGNRGQLKLDEKTVLTSFEDFHKALDCLNSRLSNTRELNRNEEILKHFDAKSEFSLKKETSSHGCYSKQFGLKRTKLDRNENGQNSRLSKMKQSYSSKLSHSIQSVRKS